MWDRPTFLDLPERDTKPRARGLTHVLDRGETTAQVEGVLANAGHAVDLVKIGWGIAYVDATVKERVRLYQSAGVMVSTGGTLLEVVEAQQRLEEFRRWAHDIGLDAVEVSNGLSLLPPGRKAELVAELSRDFVVLAEAGSKDQDVSVSVADWVAEMRQDLQAGARWVIAEGRESGTVGLYERDGMVRTDLVDSLATQLPVDRVIFEAPQRAQQTWLIRHLGANVNLGNILPAAVLPLETLRLGLRADTASVATTARGRE